MKRKQITVEQISAAVHQNELLTPVGNISRKLVYLLPPLEPHDSLLIIAAAENGRFQVI